jgi:arylesterase / paraoxonase
MKTILKISLLIIAILAIMGGRMLYNSGFFTKITPHFEGKITEINGFKGAEDIAIDREKGYAFVSSNDFSSNKNNGAIILLNLNEANPKPINLTSKLPFDDFHPHGISFFKSAMGTKELFVINHRKSGNYIEIFQINDSTLSHLESITDSLFISPNDIVGVGQRAFYFTNDHDEKLSDWRAKKDMMQIPMGNICFFDGKATKILADGFNYANGINISNDGSKLFVAATLGKKLVVFDRNKNSGDISKTDEIAINGADNIDIDENDNLWVGCHPKLLAFLAHSKDHSLPSPSEIMKISYKGKGDSKMESIYQNDGKTVSGSSVGATFGKKLLIGTVFANSVIIGQMN